MKTKIISSLTFLLLLMLLPIMTISAAEQNINKSIISLINTTHINNPVGLAIAEDGTIYFTSSDSHKIYAQSGESTSIFAGFDILDDNDNPLAGFFDSDAETALFHAPAGMDIDRDGNIYIADAGNHAIRMISTDGQVTTIAGDGIFGNADGTGEAARFNQPMDIAVAEDGTIYVADTLNHVIRKVTPDGQVTTLTKYPNRPVEVNENVVVIGGDYQDGAIDEAMFNEPANLILDEKGNLIISDSGNHVIRYINFDKNEVSTIAGTADASKYNDTTLYLDGGFADGSLLDAKFHTPKGLALTAGGNILVVDATNSHIRYLNLDNQSVQTLTANGDLTHPSQIGITANGDILVTDTRGNDLKRIVLWEMPAGFGDYLSANKPYDDENIISPYAKNAVEQLKRLNIMVGSETDESYLFSPWQNVTRAQVAKIIVNALNVRHIPDNNLFSDVESDEWYTTYVHTAAAYGIINGYSDGTFGPNDPITRQQIAIMIGRTMNWSADNKEVLYNDQNLISEEALPYVLALHEQGIMRGNEYGYFNPGQHVPREMAAVIIANLLNME